MNQISPILSEAVPTRAPTGVVLERVRALLPEIAARADEIERGATVPMDLLDKLEAAGAFRICLPAMFGGEELSLKEASQVIEEVASADASVAWHLMVAAGSQVITSRLPRESLDVYYADGPDVWPKAAAAPKGVAVPVEGGYRLSGRWSLASGARRFDWICLGFFIKEGDGVRRAPSGMPDIRICLLPRGDVKVIETWDAVGLRGTRSDDLEVHDVFVPEAWQAGLFQPSSLPGTSLGVIMPYATAPHHSAVAVGILKAALAELAQDALTRKPAFSPTRPMREEPIFLTRYGEIAAKCDALFSLADTCVHILSTCIEEGRDPTPADGARLNAAESLVHHEGTALMDQIMMLAGSSGVYASNRQQRRWRDLRCAAQHQAVSIGNYSGYAKSLVETAAARVAAEKAAAPTKAAA